MPTNNSCNYAPVQHDVLVGAASGGITSVAPSATSGVAFISQGASADPAFGTVVVAGGGTGAATLTGVLTGNGTSAFTASTITQYGTVVAGTSNAIASIAPSATSGIPYISQGAAANPTFGTAVVSGGGTGNTTFTAYSLIAAGTTATGAFQNVVGVGTSGQVLTSAGASALPTWSANAASTAFATDSGTANPSAGTITFTGSGVTISGAGSTVTITAGGGGTTATVQTTDATPTTLATIATSSNSVTTVNGYVSAAKSDYSNSCGGRITATLQNIAGTLTIIGSIVADVNTTSTATFSAVVSGTNIIIQVTGIAATTYNWKINYTTLVN